MLKYSPIKLSRLIGLDGNSKKHSSGKTTESVLTHNFRDPVQVDLVFLPEEHQRKDVDDILADDSIKLTLVEGHDRVLNVCNTLFRQNPDNPPGNIETVKNRNGKVVDWLIPSTVARSATKAAAVAYSIDHNLTTASVLGDDATLALFESDLLASQFDELLSDGQSLVGFDSDLAELAERLLEACDYQEAETDDDNLSIELPDDIDEVDDDDDAEDCRVQYGEVWQLGRHYLFCGDSLDRSSLICLSDAGANQKPTFIWADPPYGINVVGGDGKVGITSAAPSGDYVPIVGDDTIETACKAFKFYYQQFPDAFHLWWGANFYASNLPNSKCWFIWDKNTSENLFADAELAWTNATRPMKLFKHTWAGMIKDSEHGQKRVHPTQKPVALAVEAFNIFGGDRPIIFDPFLGSGISILAAESIGATCYGIELSPHYCDVCLTRFQDLTGIEPKRLNLPPY